ncbi:MAG: hypothetical protein U9O98_00490 [Asgard group archaeon]|nr:hypothetical protein [Asgard group archaeon]
MSIANIISQLLQSDDSAIRLKTYITLLGFSYDNKKVHDIVDSLKTSSPTISSIFQYVPLDTHLYQFGVYKKWQGIHWLLARLADIDYPLHDELLFASRDIEYNWLLSDKHWEKKQMINGRKRFCASQEGNGVYSTVKLGIDDDRCEKLVDRLITYQWPDGGWNCDQNPEAKHSSYHESLIPLRALNIYAEKYNHSGAKKAATKATDLFLKRNLFRRMSNNEIIDKKWLKIHYPPYWHYDYFIALKVLAEADKITDKRCSEALDLLENKQLPRGGFPKEGRYCQSSNPDAPYYHPADWGRINKYKIHEWVTIDALFILNKANRIDIEY